MTTTLDRVLELTESPSRLPADLRRRTASVAAAAAAVRLPAGVGNRPGDALAAVPLLEVLGGRLRELLSTSHDPGAAVAPGRRAPARREPDLASASEAPRTLPAFGNARETRACRWSGTGGEPATQLRARGAVPEGVASSPLVGRRHAPDAPAARVAIRSMEGADAARSTFGSRTEGTGAVLPALVREYWRLRPATTEAARAEATAARLGETARAAARDWAEAPSMGHGPERAWPERAAGEAARRVADTGVTPGALHATQAIETATAERVEIQNVFNVQVGGRGAAALNSDALAEQLGEILREQARQHGIDVS